MTQTIAFLGLGAMGSRMARRLLGRGDVVRVWNRSSAATQGLVAEGAVAAASPREAASGADVVVTMLADDTAARTVWLDPASGALAAMKPGALAMECSTVTRAWIAELAAAAHTQGVALVDSPVAGSLPAAQNGQLVFLMGGEAEAVARASAVAAPMGSAFRHVGPSGAGARFKLAVNLLLGVQVATMAEILGGLAADGFDPEEAAEALAGLPVASPAAANYARLMAAGNDSLLFTIDLMAKDMDYAAQASAAHGVKAPMAEAARAAFRAASAAGLGADNVTTVRRLYEKS